MFFLVCSHGCNGSDYRQLVKMMMKELRYIALTGNALFILWILYNGIDEGSRQVGRMEILSLTSLVLLLSFNIFLLLKQK